MAGNPWIGSIKTLVDLMGPDSPGAAAYSGGGVAPVIPVPSLPVGNTTVNGQFGPAPGLSAAASVNTWEGFVLTQTTAGTMVTPPNPTGGTAAAIGVYYFASSTSSTQSFTMLGATVPPGGALIALWIGGSYAVISASGGATLLTTLTTGDTATGGLIKDSGGVVLTAAGSVDAFAALNVPQTTAGQTLLLQSPTTATATREIVVNGKGTASFLMYGVTVSPDTSAIFAWDGGAWGPAGFGISPTLGMGLGVPTPNAGVGGLDVGGATILRPLPGILGNFTTGGVIGAAGTTVDVASGATINQTTANQDLSLPSPTNTQSGRLFTVTNAGVPFTMYGVMVVSGYAITFQWLSAAGVWQASGFPAYLEVQGWVLGTHTAALGTLNSVDISGGSATFNLPVISNKSYGQIVAIDIYKVAALAITNKVTLVAGTGNTIGNGATGGSYQMNGLGTLLLMVDFSGTNWSIVGQVGGPALGPNLPTGASASGRLARSTLYVLPATTLTAASTNTLPTALAEAGDTITILRLDTTAFVYTIAGAVSLAMPQGVVSSQTWQFDGTAWQPLNVGSVTPSIQSGTFTLTAGTVSISAKLTASSRITLSFLNNPAALTTILQAPTATRNVAASTFVVNGLVAALTVNGADNTTTGDYTVIG